MHLIMHYFKNRIQAWSEPDRAAAEAKGDAHRANDRNGDLAIASLAAYILNNRDQMIDGLMEYEN